MAALGYKLEFFHNGNGEASDEGCFVQLRSDVSAYTTLVSKEAYATGTGTTSELATTIFAIPGIVRLALQGFRVYVEKSPAFEWNEITPDLLTVLMNDTGCNSLNELPGSGLVLDSQYARRGFF
jgi:hypothetical protein